MHELLQTLRKAVPNIRIRIFSSWIIASIVIIVLIYNIILTALYKFSIIEIENQLLSELQLIECIIDPGDWYITNDNLYKGNTHIGNMNKSAYYLNKLAQIKQNTSMDVNIFICDNDNYNVHYIYGQDGKSHKQSHYRKVAGADRETINRNTTGIYIANDIADELDIKNIYIGNIDEYDGRETHCVYKTIKDSQGVIVGAITISNSSIPVKQIIRERVNTIIIMLVCCFLACGLIVYLLFNHYTKSIILITRYLRQLHIDNLPDEKLLIETGDEMELIATAINQFIESLKESQKLKLEVEKDLLTGLYNRYWLSHYKNELLHGYRDQYIAMLMISIDDFKKYNDAYGHNMGDKCLIKVVECIKSSFNAENTYCIRLNSAEFLVLAFGMNSFVIEQRIKALKLLVAGMNIKHEYATKDNKITLSIGVALDKIKENFYDKVLISKVNESLCNAKQNGKTEIIDLYA